MSSCASSPTWLPTRRTSGCTDPLHESSIATHQCTTELTRPESALTVTKILASRRDGAAPEPDPLWAGGSTQNVGRRARGDGAVIGPRVAKTTAVSLLGNFPA